MYGNTVINCDLPCICWHRIDVVQLQKVNQHFLINQSENFSLIVEQGARKKNWSWFDVLCNVLFSDIWPTVLLQFLMHLSDHSTLPWYRPKTLLHLSQLIQMAVPHLRLQLHLLLLERFCSITPPFGDISLKPNISLWPRLGLFSSIYCIFQKGILKGLNRLGPYWVFFLGQKTFV